VQLGGSISDRMSILHPTDEGREAAPNLAKPAAVAGQGSVVYE